MHAAGDEQGGLKTSISSAKAVERMEAQFRYHGTMRFDPARIIPIAVACLLLPALGAWPARSRQLSSSSSAQHVRKPSSAADSTLDPGSVGNGVYRNKALAVACKIPPGWVLRTDEMNTRPPTEDPQPNDGPSQDKRDNAPEKKPDASSGSVLLAAFSRPPEAMGEDVNSSIVIAAESSTSYPGLKDAAQYFGPLTEVATARGFKVVNEPYQFLSGTKMLVRGDFAKDRGTRAMHQATLVMLRRGYAISFTFIGGTEDELEELIQGLVFEDRPRPSGSDPKKHLRGDDDSAFLAH